MSASSTLQKFAPNFIYRTLDDLKKTEQVKVSYTKTWESRRYLTRKDGFGFSFHHTIIRAGTSTLIKYNNHVEAVLVTSGVGEIELCLEDQREGEGFAVLKLNPGVFYGLGGQEKHYLRASDEQDLHVCCAFNPPIDGPEDHDSEGVYPAIGEKGIPYYQIGEKEARELFKPPVSLYSKVQASAKLRASLGNVCLREPKSGDGSSMWSIAGETGLDLNSPYMYNIFTRHHSRTCLVADDDSGVMVAFLLGYVLPSKPDTYFVWQIGVDSGNQKLGIAFSMLETLTRELDISYVEATVTVSNVASNNFFKGFASKKQCGIEVTNHWMKEDEFPKSVPHEPESLYRIGPF